MEVNSDNNGNQDMVPIIDGSMEISAAEQHGYPNAEFQATNMPNTGNIGIKFREFSTSATSSTSLKNVNLKKKRIRSTNTTNTTNNRNTQDKSKQVQSNRLNSGNFTTDTSMEELEIIITHFFQNQSTFWNIYSLEIALELLRRVSLEVIKLSSKALSQEERVTALLQQIVQQQTKTNIINEQSITSSTASYLSVAKNAEVTQSIRNGNRLPVSQIPEAIRHSPPERIILIKAQNKGTTATKQDQEELRSNLKQTLGEELSNEVSAIRPTRYGGHTLILRSEEARDKASQKIEQAGIILEDRFVKPTKKNAKMLCRDIPNDVTQQEVMEDLYSKHNPELVNIPVKLRQAKIFPTKLGWIFDLSSIEAAAIDAQFCKIRYGFGKEMKLEEFIPLQQCYRCCRFGHNAANCANDEVCRLCARKGHSGRDCNNRNDKTRWRCHNCIHMNEQRGMNLCTQHAAAQLHKCSVAEYERETRRAQLASAGVYVTVMI